ncbi:MAG: aminoacyl-tRNA hydrolase [Planctomycetota bacterium]|nr:aminoacyl-tRNA hydrolase [Planctomycetota bacterium]
MKVVVGLGNPGGEYEWSRHNAGWLALAAVARRFAAGRFFREGTVEAAECLRSGEKIYLLKPMGYMNRSGQSLAAWLEYYREIREEIRSGAGGPPDRGIDCDWPGLLVLADDVNLPLGRLRLRPAGSSGGHNGLRDLEKALGGPGYPRLRLGVGAAPRRLELADHVLGRFSREEEPAILRAAETSAEAVACWTDSGLEAARNRFNGPDPAGADA